jgi:hypothetical protein
MTDLELVRDVAFEFERFLGARLGARGDGLGKKAINVQGKLPKCLFKNLMYVARIRNNVIHRKAPIPERKQFEEVCADIKHDLHFLDEVLNRKVVDEHKPAPRGQLIVESPSGNRRVYDLGNKGAKVGRAKDKDNDVVLADDYRVSRQHAKITYDLENGYVVRDLNSTNGTYVNEEQVVQRVLEHGDKIRIGRCELRFNSKV